MAAHMTSVHVINFMIKKMSCVQLLVSVRPVKNIYELTFQSLLLIRQVYSEPAYTYNITKCNFTYSDP